MKPGSKRLFMSVLLCMCAMLQYTWGRRAFEPWVTLRAERQRTEGAFLLPHADVLAMSSLNHKTFAASMVWIDALIYFGTYRMEKWEVPPEHLHDYADIIALLDPDFYQVYQWLNVTYINTHHPVSHQVLNTATDFLDRGLEAFPNNSELLYTAAMNYVGYSAKRAKKERIVELERAIGYLRRCALLPSCNTAATSVAAALLERKQMLERSLDKSPEHKEKEKENQKSQKKFYMQLLLSLDEPDRIKSITTRLRTLGVSDDELAQLFKTRVDRFQHEHRLKYNILFPDLWALVAPAPEPLIFKSTLTPELP